MRIHTLLLVIISVVGCSGVSIDPGPDALASNAVTLAVSSCDGYIMSGLGKCTAVEGSPIQSVWRVIVPIQGDLLTGELAVKFRDIIKTYAIRTQVVEVPWKDFFTGPNWSLSDSGVATATATIRWKDPTGLEKIVQAKGHVFLSVEARDYVGMPIDSGFQAWETTCRIQYSVKGRSAIQCN